MTKSVLWSSCSRLSCINQESPDVVLCLTSSDLLANTDCVRTTIDGVLTKHWKECDSCNVSVYRYLISYDETLLADPTTALTTAQVSGVFCKGCLTDWVIDEIGCLASGAVCVVNTVTVDLSITDAGCIQADVNVSQDQNNQLSISGDGLFVPAPAATCVTDSQSIDFSIDGGGCVTGDVLISADADNGLSLHTDGLYSIQGGGGGAGWLLTGNSGTVEGTNFCGTLDTTPFQLRVNNLQVAKFWKAGTPDPWNSQTIVLGDATNTIDASALGIGNSIFGGSSNQILSADENAVIMGESNTLDTHEGLNNGILGGYSNSITSLDRTGDNATGAQSNVIAGGDTNLIDDSGTSSLLGAAYANAIGGGHSNTIHASPASTARQIESNVIAGGASHIIEDSGQSVIVGGEGNFIFGDSTGTLDQGWNFIGGGTGNEVNHGTMCTIPGGFNNYIHDDIPTSNAGSTIAGGSSNIIDLSQNCVISGGFSNSITSAVASVIGGGGKDALYGGGAPDPNTIQAGYFSTIGGGAGNLMIPDATPDGSFGGGYSTIGGGRSNIIEMDHIPWIDHTNPGQGFQGTNTIAGGDDNLILSSDYQTIAGGFANQIAYPNNFGFIVTTYIAYDTIGGGNSNQILGSWNTSRQGTTTIDYMGYNFIGGGDTNEIDNGYANTLCGGEFNFISPRIIATSDFGFADYNFLGGGTNNNIGTTTLTTCTANFIGGGDSNTITGGQNTVITGGHQNTIDGTNNVNDTATNDVISGGIDNAITFTADAGGNNTVGGGISNWVEDGESSTICGGAGNKISGVFSTILGGQQLHLGANSVGFQGNRGNFVGVNLSSFPAIGYFGEVDVWIANSDNTARKLKFFEPNTDQTFAAPNYSSFKAQPQSANIDYIWPASAGTAGQQLTIDTVVGTVVTLKWA